MHFKGVSEVVAVILLLFITVAFAGLAWLYLSNVVKSTEIKCFDNATGYVEAWNEDETYIGKIKITGELCKSQSIENSCEYWCVSNDMQYWSYTWGSCFCNECRNFTYNNKSYSACIRKEFLGIR